MKPAEFTLTVPTVLWCCFIGGLTWFVGYQLVTALLHWTF